MRIGDLSGNIPDDIKSLGFTFVNKLKLLGFIIPNYGDKAAANFETVSTRIDNLIRFWERFYLSMPGKISIYESILLPQLNFVATILTPSADTMKNIEEKMERFVTKGFSLSKERIYAQVNDGGLGLFNLTEFVAGLQCSWIKRCYKSINDNWRYTLLLLSNGNILNTVNDNYCLEKAG